MKRERERIALLLLCQHDVGVFSGQAYCEHYEHSTSVGPNNLSAHAQWSAGDTGVYCTTLYVDSRANMVQSF